MRIVNRKDFRDVKLITKEIDIVVEGTKEEHEELLMQISGDICGELSLMTSGMLMEVEQQLKEE